MIRSFPQQRVQRRVSCPGLLSLCLSTLLLAGCGGLQGDHSVAPVVVSPAQAQLRAGDTQQFTAQVTGAGQPTRQNGGTYSPSGLRPQMIAEDVRRVPLQNDGISSQVTWLVNGVAGGNSTVGTINEKGLYTAPAVLPSSTSIKVTAASVSNPSQSGSAAISLENPVPVIQSAQPNPVTVGNFSLTIAGSKFVKGVQVLLNGAALQTTFVSATQLTATGTATQSEVGTATIAIKNPDPGAILSTTTYSLDILPPLTVAVKVSPPTAQIREGASQQFSATVMGSGNTAVTWSVNGVAGGNSSFGTVDSKGLYHAPSGLPNPNPLKVKATSVADTRASDSATTTIDNPAPQLISLSPPTVNVENFTLAVTGSNFVNGAALVFDGQLLVTNFVNSTQLTAVGTATDQEIGQVQVLVQNPDPGSSDSNKIAEQHRANRR